MIQANISYGIKNKIRFIIVITFRIMILLLLNKTSRVRVHCNVFGWNNYKAAGEASQAINEGKPMMRCGESSGGRCPGKMTCEFSRKARVTRLQTAG